LRRVDRDVDVFGGRFGDFGDEGAVGWGSIGDESGWYEMG
jgi:hypothetical protein